MSDKWTNQQRYDDAKAYLATVDAGLAAHMQQNLQVSQGVAGGEISLKGNTRYAMTPGNAAVGRAVRALLLCQKAYLGQNWARGTGGALGVPADRNSPNGAQMTMDTYLSKSETTVRDAIRAYISMSPSVASVADAAEQVGNGTSTINPPFEKLTRAQNPFPSGLVCFNCVYWWLFKSGSVSLRWILKKGMALGAENANTFLGQGTPLQRTGTGGVPPIPRGMVVNWRGSQRDSQNICHWAVSLGDGYAIGANNTQAGRTAGVDIDVRFRKGGVTRTRVYEDSQFGVFSIDDMWTVYEGIKTHSPTANQPGCIMAVIDPNHITNRNTGD